MTAALAFACGAAAGWCARRAYARWHNARLSRADLIGSIVMRAP